MEWNWLYLIPIGMGLISVIIWLIVFFINYKNTKSLSSAVSAASQVVNEFKGVTKMTLIRNKDGAVITTDSTSEEVTEDTTVTEETSSNTISTLTTEPESPEADKAEEDEIIADIKLLMTEIGDYLATKLANKG